MGLIASPADAYQYAPITLTPRSFWDNLAVAEFRVNRAEARRFYPLPRPVFAFWMRFVGPEGVESRTALAAVLSMLALDTPTVRSDKDFVESRDHLEEA